MLVLLSFVGLLSACEIPVLGIFQWERQPGVIDIGGEDPAPGGWSVPDTAAAGIPFEITVVTYGLAGCTKPRGVEVRVSEATADVRPFDLIREGGECKSQLRYHPRAVTITLPRTGDAVLRVHGTNLQKQPATWEFNVVVR